MHSLVLLSGGPDSILCLEMARQKGPVSAIFFNYHQPAEDAERSAATNWCKKRNVPLHEIYIELYKAEMTSAKGPGPRIVPHRNLNLLARAANLAADLDCDALWIGATKDDVEYRDCGEDYLQACSQLIGMPIHSLTALSKADVMTHPLLFDTDPAEMWSCYTPQMQKPCGMCNSCIQRNNTEIVLRNVNRWSDR